MRLKYAFEKIIPIFFLAPLWIFFGSAIFNDIFATMHGHTLNREKRIASKNVAEKGEKRVSIR